MLKAPSNGFMSLRVLGNIGLVHRRLDDLEFRSLELETQEVECVCVCVFVCVRVCVRAIPAILSFVHWCN